MCKGGSIKRSTTKRRPLFLTTEESFSNYDGPPSKASTFATTAALIAIMYVIERTLRLLLDKFQNLHPLLDDEISRHILARHLGVDALSCAVVALLGWKSRGVCQGMVSRVLYRTDSMPESGCEERMFGYHAAAFRLALVFFSYQVKNLVDTIVWGDGPEYVFHHVAAGTAAYMGLYPGFAHFYAIFYLGISEISTAVLCVLANFDDQHGVPGLGDAFPAHKAAIGVSFVIFFVICRVIMWPVATYYFTKDSSLVLERDSPQAKALKTQIRAVNACLAGLTVLQVVFLVQLVLITKKELTAMGFI